VNFSNFEKNELEGTLPATIANATRLKTLYVVVLIHLVAFARVTTGFFLNLSSVQSNYFYGPVPDSILASDELVRVNLASNGFGCPSPAFFQRLNQRTWTYCDFALNSFDNDGYSICNGLVPGYLSATPSRCFWTPQAPPQMNPPTSDPDYWFGNERVICKIYGRRPYFFALNSTGSPLNYEFQAFELQGIWERAVDSSFRMEEYQLHTYHHFDNPSPGVHRAFAKLNGTNTDFIVTFDLNTNGEFVFSMPHYLVKFDTLFFFSPSQRTCKVLDRRRSTCIQCIIWQRHVQLCRQSNSALQRRHG
jgi:hypothetical protein